MRKKRNFWKTKKGKLATAFIVTGLFLGVGSGLLLSDTIAENKKTVTADQIADAMTGKKTDEEETSEDISSTSTPYPKLNFSKSDDDNNNKKSSDDSQQGCSYGKQKYVIDKPATDEKVQTGTKTVVDKPAWDETVVDKQAYDEPNVPDGYQYTCNLDGKIFNSLEEFNTHNIEVHEGSSGYSTQQKFKTVHHDAATHVVHHDAVTHEEPVYQIVHHNSTGHYEKEKGGC